MENILKKALGEVLTPKYSEELRDSFDTGYAPSQEFESGMRELIRKTDRPAVFRYTRYFAAAAAVALAIGAAVLVPVLVNSGRIAVSEPEDTTDAVTELASPTSDITVSVTEPPVAAEDSVTETGDTDNVADIIVSEDDTETDSPSAETTASGTITSSGTDTTPETTVPDSENASSGGNTDTSADDDINNDVDVAENENDTTENDEPTGDDDEVVVDADDDDVAEVDDDCDLPEADDDYDHGDGDDDAAIVIEKTKDINVTEGDKLSDVFAKNFGGIGFDSLYAVSGRYKADNGSLVPLDMSLSDHAFIQDLVHGMGDAVTNNTHIESTAAEQYVMLTVCDRKPQHIERTDGYVNYSAWLDYGSLFGNGESEDFVDEEDDFSDTNETLSFVVKIYKSGRISFDEYINYRVPSANKSEKYKIGADFFISEETVNKLFDDIAARFMPDNAGTFGEAVDRLGITPENISQAFTNVDGVYDTLIYNGKIDHGYIEKLFTKYSSRKVAVAKIVGSHLVRINIVTVNDVRIVVDLCSDGYIYIDDLRSRYRLRYENGEVEDALNAIASANNINIPFYGTLGDYLADKNFTGISKLVYGEGSTTYALDDAEELKAFTDLLRSEFNTAKYTYAASETNGSNAVQIYVPGYQRPLSLYSQRSGVLNIRTNSSNRFMLSDGFSQKFLKLLKENSKTKRMTDEDEDTIVYVDDIDSDDVDYEEVIDDEP